MLTIIKVYKPSKHAAMKSVTILKRGNKNISAPQKTDDVIILPYLDMEEDMDQLIREMEEEEMLAKENQAKSLMAEINNLNTIRFAELPRVA